MEKLPTYSIDLINKLDELYPEQSPDPKDSERVLWIKAGKRELVRSLLAMKKETESDMYSPDSL